MKQPSTNPDDPCVVPPEYEGNSQLHKFIPRDTTIEIVTPPKYLSLQDFFIGEHLYIFVYHPHSRYNVSTEFFEYLPRSFREYQPSCNIALEYETPFETQHIIIKEILRFNKYYYAATYLHELGLMYNKSLSHYSDQNILSSDQARTVYIYEHLENSECVVTDSLPISR